MPFIVAGGRRNQLCQRLRPNGATTADRRLQHGLSNNVPIVTQISNYLAAVHNVADPNALYMISYGANDLL